MMNIQQTISNFFSEIQFLSSFSKEQEQAYLDFVFNRSLKSLRGAILFSIFLFFAFAGLDKYTAPYDYGGMWVFRLIYCGYAVIILAYSYTVFFKPLHQLVMGSLIVVGAICLLGILIIPLEQQIQHVYYTTFILLVFFNFTLTNLRFGYAVGIAIITLLLYIATSIFHLEVFKEGWFSIQGTLFVNNVFFLLLSIVLGAVVCAIMESYKRKDYIRRIALQKEQQKSNALLLNILPVNIAERLKNTPQTIADVHDNVSILFADLVGFTKLASEKSPKEVVEILDAIFSKFDWLAGKFQLEKIKTIGDAYMVAGGLDDLAQHPIEMADMALSMQRELAKYNRHFNTNLQLRIGIHIGSVVAGVIGSKKISYDIWGDSVNVASRMESTSQVGEIQVSEQTYQAIKNEFTLLPRGVVNMKGKGELFTYFLKG